MVNSDWWLVLLILTAAIFGCSQGPSAAATLAEADRLLAGPEVKREQLLQAWQLYQELLPMAGSQRRELLTRLARTAYLLGEENEGRARQPYYEQGRDYAQQLLAEFPQQAAGHYWLALNLAGLADINRWQGRKLLPQIMAHLNEAGALDPAYDQAGPWRTLGRIYFSAPGPPLSVGDLEQSRRLLAQAVALAPENATNHLYLGETLLRLGAKEAAIQELRRVLTAPCHADTPAGLAADRRRARELLATLEP